jgi:hypothetical protein
MFGEILGVLGGAAKVVGAIGAKNAAQDEIGRYNLFSSQQRGVFDAAQADLMAQGKGASTYQKDLSQYQNLKQQADLNKRMASGQSRGSGEQIARDQAAQTSANVLAAATRGAGSGTDIMTAALMSQQGENAAQNAISTRSAAEQIASKNVAQQNEFTAYGQMAAADARERGLVFQSQANKEANIMGLTQNRLEGQMNLDNNLYEGMSTKIGAVADATNAIWSGVGDLLGGASKSMMASKANKLGMSNLQKMYQTGIDKGIKSRPEVAALMGNPLTGATGQNISFPAIGGFQMGSPAMTAQQSFDANNSWDPINKTWFSTGN